MRESKRPKGKTSFERRLDILIFAVHTPRHITVGDVSEAVLDGTRSTIRECMNDLVSCGYLQKVSIYEYLATAKAKELFGVAA